MPDLDGIGVVDALESADHLTCPQIIFVTAYNTYMKRAFEVHAVDYLEKPYTTARFQSALAHGRQEVLLRRVQREVTQPAGYAAIAALQSDADDDIIAVHIRETGTWHRIPVEEIDWIESDGSAHVRLHRGQTSYRWRKSLSECEERLANRGFLRVHRSYVVNPARIQSVKSLQKGEFTLLFAGGGAIDTGRTFRDVIQRFLTPR